MALALSLMEVSAFAPFASPVFLFFLLGLLLTMWDVEVIRGERF
jgi:hypothetical protein